MVFQEVIEGLRFITGRFPPSFLGTTKRLLTKLFVGDGRRDWYHDELRVFEITAKTPGSRPSLPA